MTSDGNIVNLYTSAGWLKGTLEITRAGISWNDVDLKSVNTLKIAHKAIFAVILSDKQRKAFRTIKEAAKDCETSKDSSCFTVFTISKNESHTKDNKNNKRPVCDSWSFNARDNKTALFYIRQIQELIRPEYNTKVHNVLVMINPQSGTKKSTKTFKDFVEPVFKLSNVKYKVVETDGPQHATEYMRKEDLTPYTAYCSVSGDGLLHEMVNGLLKRPDWKKHKNTPFAVIPAGSGNGLAWSVDCGWPELASISIAKKYVKPLDVMAVSKPAEDPRFLFLSFTFGYVADVDIESEFLRAFGDLRLDIYGAFRLFKLHRYQGKIHYLPVEQDLVANASSAKTQPSGSVDNAPSPGKDFNGQRLDMSINAPFQILSQNNSVHKPSPLKNLSSPSDSAYNSCDFTEGDSCSTPKPSAIHTQILSKLETYAIEHPVSTTNLSSKWETVEGPFTLINAVNVPWLSKTFLCSEEANICDGTIDLVWSTTKSRSKLIPYLTSSESGGYLNKNGAILHRKVSSIIIEPEVRAPRLGNSGKGATTASSTKGTTDGSSTTQVPKKKERRSKKPASSGSHHAGVFSLDGEPSSVDYVKIDMIPGLIKIVTSPWFENISLKNKSTFPRADSRAALFDMSKLSKSNSTVSFF